MKDNNDQNLRSISSFSEFVMERKRLRLKKTLIEARLRFNAVEIKEIITLKRGLSLDQIQVFIQKFSDILERIVKPGSRSGKNDTAAGTEEL
jgi:hypothetical protein